MATSTAQAIATVPVWDYLMAPGDPTNTTPKGLPGKKVKVTLSYAQGQSASPVTLLGTDPVNVQTDANGFWQVNLVPNNKISPNGTIYTVEIEGYRSYVIQVTDVNAPGIGWQSSAIATLPPIGGGAPGYTLPGGTIVLGGFSIAPGETGLDVSSPGLLVLGDNVATGIELGSPAFGVMYDTGGAVFNLGNYCKVDGQVDINVTSVNGQPTISTTTSPGPWKATDIGKSFVLQQSGGANPNLYGTITGFTDSQHITLSANALGGFAAQAFCWFTDNTVAIQAVINGLPKLNANNALVGGIELPTGICGFTGQLTQPQGTSIRWRGQNKAGSGLFYGGSVQRAAIVLPGGNQGTTFEQMWATGPLADPMIDVQTFSLGVGSGTAYNSFVSTIDANIGFPLANANALPGIFLSYSGMKMQCDIFEPLNTIFYGRNYGIRLQAGTTDAYFTNCHWSSNPQGGESRGIGLWCEDVAAGLLFAGTVHLVNCSAALGAETTTLLRSIADVYGLYMESFGGVGVKATACTLHMFAGKIATNFTTATHLIQCINSHGFIIGTYLGAPAGANALVDLINCSSSPFVQAWDIILPPKASILGTLPATLVACDAPHVLSFVGNTGPGTAQQYNGQSFDTDSASNLLIGLVNAAAIFIAKAGVLTAFGGSIQVQPGGNVDPSSAGTLFLGGTNATIIQLGNTNAGNNQIRAANTFYPAAEAQGIQIGGGLLHSTGVPSNANGNNNDWCFSDNHHLYTRSGGVWIDMTAAVTAQSTPGNPAGTASTVGVMMGLAGAITPVRTGTILVIVSGDIFNNTINDGGTVQIRTGTGTAPTNGVALTGTAQGGKPATTAAVGSEKSPFSVQAVVTGLTLGTAVWIDLAVAAVTGGTATVENISISAVEV